MTILFFARRFHPDIGGVEKHVLEISKRLVEAGHNVTVVTQSPGIESKILGIKVKRINTSHQKIGVWKWLWQNKSLINDADIVHCHDVYYWYFPFKVLFPMKKSFVTFHGYETYPIKKRAILIRKLSELLSNGNIIVGDFIKKWYGTNPTYVIYGGVDVPKSFNLKMSRESAIFIGRLDEQTGILDYAKAVDLIRKKYPNFNFKIYGDGKYKDELKRFNPSGFIPNAEKNIKNYHFAFVSRYLSILEALAQRRLVFALYDNPVKEDYLKMTPFAKFIVTENNPKELSKKVEYFLKHTEKEENALVKGGYGWVNKQTWSKVTDVYLKLWKI